LEVGKTLFISLQQAQSGVIKSIRKRIEIHLARRVVGGPAIDDEAIVRLFERVIDEARRIQRIEAMSSLLSLLFYAFESERARRLSRSLDGAPGTSAVDHVSRSAG
jgi:hypothetical protein